MSPDTTYCLFVQKRSTIKIVPEDIIVITGSKQTYLFTLKPAVSLVSLEELESVTDKPSPVESDDSATKSEVERDSETSDLPHGDRLSWVAQTRNAVLRITISHSSRFPTSRSLNSVRLSPTFFVP
jgi:hypothetical protein